jgi:hypothetical protein
LDASTTLKGKIMTRFAPIALATLILLGGGTIASAHDDEDSQERAALRSAKLTLAEAIVAAEKEVPGGKVVDAEVDFENGVASYFIEIDKDGVQAVRVDMETGKALKVATDSSAESAHHDDDDEDDEENGEEHDD